MATFALTTTPQTVASTAGTVAFTRSAGDAEIVLQPSWRSAAEVLRRGELGGSARLTIPSGGTVTAAIRSGGGSASLDVTTVAATSTTDASASTRAVSVLERSVLKPYFARLANRATSRCNVVVIGDSITSGQGATAQGKRWVTSAAAQMRSRLGLPAGGVGYIGASGNGVNSFTWPAALSGSPPIHNDYGPSRSAATMTAGTHVVTYAAIRGTAVDLVCYGANASTVNVVVDGGAPSVVSITSGGNDGQLKRVSLGSSGVHSLSITFATGGFYLDGIIVYDGDETTGLMVHDAGHYGWRTIDWSGSSQLVARWPSAIAALDPALIVFALGQNDVSSGVTTAVMRNAFDIIMSTIRSKMGSTAPPFLFVPYAARQNYSAAWPSYVQTMADIAAADSASDILDLSRLLPNYDDANNFGGYADQVHPNDIIHGMIADRFASFLLP